MKQSGVCWLPGVLKTLLREEILANGLRIVFTDESNRYFGDYHRVCVVATMTCDLQRLVDNTPVDESFWTQVRSTLGEKLQSTRRFERMGVPSARVDEVRSALIDDFMRHTTPYLGRIDYLHSLAEAEMGKRRPRRTYAP